MDNKKNIFKITLFFIYLLIIWGIYRFLWLGNYLWDELFFKPLLWLLPTLYLVKKIEKEKLVTLGLVFDKPLKNILLGLGASLFILTEYSLAIFLKGKKIDFNPEGIRGAYWLLYFFACLATGIVEEIAFRGFFMTRINRLINDKLISNIITGLLFFLIHFPILIFVQHQNMMGIMQFFVLSVSLGVIDGYIFWKTKGILAPIATHSSLNFFSLLIG